MTATKEYIPFSEYVARPEVNNGWLKEMDKSALHFETSHLRPYQDTAPKKIGRPIHTSVLEPDRFDTSVLVWRGGFTQGKDPKPTKSKNSLDYKKLAARAKAEDKEILDESEVVLCQNVRRAIFKHPEASKYLTGGEAEVSIFWDHPIGVRCKLRADYLRGDCFSDLKSAIDVGFDGFGRAANKFEYHVQGAMYQDGIEALTGKRLPFYIVAVEKNEPFDVVVYEVPDVALDLGRAIYEDRLRKVRDCRATGFWPGVSARPVTLELPNWAYEQQIFAMRCAPEHEKGDASAL